MVSAEMQSLLMKLGEAGGITGMITAVLALLIKMIKRKGCTCKVHSCSGQPLVEVDCEEGAPSKRYIPKRESESDEGSSDTK